MADGTYTRTGSVANNFLPLGAKVKTSRSIFGHRYFRVRDRIGFGSQFDVWTSSCSQAIQYGRRMVTIYRVR